MKIYLYLLFSSLFVLGCGKVYWTTITGQIVEKYRFNIVGILGEESDTAYIEVWYSEATEDGKNRVVHKWVKPPIIIGGHYSNVTYNEVTSNGALKYAKEAIIDYSEGGSHYMKIVNHGSDPIEYFIAGAHPVVVTDFNDEYAGLYRDSLKPPTTLHYDIYPRVLYKNASIYFLLNPQEKPKTNQYVLELSGIYEGDYYNYKSSQTIFFESNRIGDILVDKPWTIEQVMSLYKEEYVKKNGTLVLKYNNSDQDKFVLSKSHKLYYGFISSGASLQSGEKTPFVTDVCGDNYVCRSFENEYRN